MKETFCCPCLLGVEGLVAEELRDMGCENVQAENGRVLFTGDMQMAARVNIQSRIAERVLILAGKFEAKTFEQLFEQVKMIEWEKYLPKDAEFPVSGSSLNSALYSIPDCQAIIKKAIVERLRQKYHIDWFAETGSLYRVRFQIMKDAVSVMIDMSGEGLHKRGYRKKSSDAPIKETLAAAMVKLVRVRDDGNFIDPFCGSGTLPIEAAMRAMNIAPGINRRFAAEKWRQIPTQVWAKERELARDMEKRNVTFHASGYDIDQEMIALTLANAKKAGVDTHISAEIRDIKDFDTSAEYGCVICNPPYGERLLNIQEAERLYRTMGAKFTQKRGWSYAVISPSEEFEKLFGRKADKNRKLYNGMIKCQMFMYFKWQKGIR